jgi:hypothetical protein
MNFIFLATTAIFDGDQGFRTLFVGNQPTTIKHDLV